MIVFDNSKPGLAEALDAAGLRVAVIDGEWWASDPIAAQAFIDAYVPPAPPAPALPALTRKQLRLGLLNLGVTASQVSAIIATMPDPIARETAAIAWEESAYYEFDHPLIGQVIAAMSLDPEAVRTEWAAATHY